MQKYWFPSIYVHFKASRKFNRISFHNWKHFFKSLSQTIVSRWKHKVQRQLFCQNESNGNKWKRHSFNKHALRFLLSRSRENDCKSLRRSFNVENSLRSVSTCWFNLWARPVIVRWSTMKESREYKVLWSKL